jgi:DnaJ-class molecular chaperone
MDANRDKPEKHDPDTANLTDHYAVLQVDASASQQEIARAYRALMRNLHPDVDHPDVDGGSPGGAAAGQSGSGQSGSARNSDLLRIMQAFAVLRDPASRATYDQSRAGPAAVSRPQAGPQTIPVRYVRSRGSQTRPMIRITPVRWESGPWT